MANNNHIAIILDGIDHFENLSPLFNSFQDQKQIDFIIYIASSSSEKFHSFNDTGILNEKGINIYNYLYTGKNTCRASIYNAGAEIAIDQGAKSLLFVEHNITLAPTIISDMEQISCTLTNPSVIELRVALQHEPWKILHGGYYWDNITYCWENISYLEYQTNHEIQLEKCQYLSGKVIYVPSNLYLQVGPFNVRFEEYYDGVDWSIKASRMGIDLYLTNSPLAFCSEFDGKWTCNRENTLKKRKYSLLLQKNHNGIISFIKAMLAFTYLTMDESFFRIRLRVPKDKQFSLFKRLLWATHDFFKDIGSQSRVFKEGMMVVLTAFRD